MRSAADAEESLWLVILKLLLPVYIPSLLFGLSDGLVLSIIPLFARTLVDQDGYVGLISAARSIGKLLADIPSGVIYAKIGCKWTMTLGLLGTAFSALLIGFAVDALKLMVLLVVSGLCEALYTVSRSSYIKTTIGNKQRGRVLSIIGGLNRLTRAIGPAIGGWISLLGVNVPFYARCGTAAVAVFFILLAWPNPVPATQESKQSNAQDEDSPDDVVHERPLRTEPQRDQHSVKGMVVVVAQYWRTILPAGTFVFTLSLLRGARNTIISLQGDNMGLSSLQIGWVMTVGYIIDTVMFLPVGAVMDRLGRKFLGMPALVLLSVGLALVAIVPLPHPPLTLVANTTYGTGSQDSVADLGRMSFVVVSLILGLGNGLSTGVAMVLGIDLAPPAPNNAPFLGVWALITDLGQVTGPLLLGVVAEVTSLQLACVLCAVVGLVGCLALQFGVQETLRTAPDSPQQECRDCCSKQLERAPFSDVLFKNLSTDNSEDDLCTSD